MDKTFTNKSIIEEYLHNQPSYEYCHLQEINEGVSTEVYRLINNDEIQYIRISQDENMWSKEAEVYNLFQQQNLHTPRLILKARTAQLFFLITSEIPGQPLCDTTTNINSILETAGEELAKINSIKAVNFGFFDDSTFKNYNSFLFNNFEIKLNALTKLGFFTKKEQDHLLKNRLGYEKLSAKINQPYLAHGDFDLTHIYENNQNYSGIIDFGDIRGTSQFHDISHLFMFERNDYFNKVVEGFQKVIELPKNWMAYVLMETLGFGISKIYWISQNRPEKLTANYPVFKRLKAL